MGKTRMLLVYDDPDTLKFAQKTLNHSGSHVTSFSSPKGLNHHLNKNNYKVVVVQPQKGCMDELKNVLEKGSFRDTFFIIASNHLLKSNLKKIHDLSNGLKNIEKKHYSPSIPSRDLFLNDFVEMKLKDFVSRMSRSRGRNLYSLLIKEIEKPLISMILNETQGNQVKAAHLLGVNRNTLRKKIKDLKITVKKDKKGKRSATPP